MDAVTLGMAKASTRRSLRGITLAQFAAVRSKLGSGLENVVIVVLGDSTGNGTTRWVYKLTTMLAARFPAYTVRFKPWNVATDSYDGWVTVQTGTGTSNSGGPFTLDIYNGSASGKDPAYSRLNLIGSNKLIPYTVMLDLLLVNHSHNMGTVTDTAVNNAFYMLVRDALRWYNSQASVVLMSQNPETVMSGSSLVPHPDEHQKRMTRIAETAATHGWGYINVNQVFLENPNWVSEWMTPADGLHPSEAGSLAWARMIYEVFEAAGPYAAPTAARGDVDTILIPASAFTPTKIVSSSPAKAVVGDFIPTVAYGDVSDECGATVPVHIPPSWKGAYIWVDWTTQDGAAGNVVWRVDVAYQNRIAQEITSGQNGTALAVSTSIPATVPGAPTVALGESHALIGSGYSGLGLSNAPTPQGTRRLFLRLTRLGANGNDTLAGVAHVFQVRIERAF